VSPSGAGLAGVALGLPGISELPTRTYEEIDGAEGREVFFRPHRYTAAELAPLAARVTVQLPSGERDCELLDVSQNGVAMVWPAEIPMELRQKLKVVVRFDARESFRGEAVVGSVRRDQHGSTVVGISFVDYMLDVEELLQLRVVRRWGAQSAQLRANARPWHFAAHDRFKAAVAELRLYLEDAQEQLTALEAELPWNVLQSQDHPARESLVANLRAGFVEDAVRLGEAVDAALRHLPEGHRDVAAKEWSLRHVHEYLMQAPILHRARYKPLGYPGDYGVMDFIYDRSFEGATLFARAVSLAFTNTRAALAVRCRKDLVKRELKALLHSRRGASQPVRILSIAAGPAQELIEVFSELEEMPAPVEVVLFEQDKNALTQAWRRLKRVCNARFSGSVRLLFLQDSIKRLVRDGSLFEPFGRFDFVYCCGLYDYLQRSTAVVLTRRLAEATKPGGQLLVANMLDHPTRWIMEHHLEWKLIYRTHEELMDIGRHANPGAQLRILEEASGVNPFLEMVHE
jgi:extracellular factor (EF) 3-hydroxypalmitic acid methyl ester biosynthesis protein